MSCGLCEQELRYNGYDNYPTWCVVNHLLKDKDQPKHWTTLAKANLRSISYNHPGERDSLDTFRLSNELAQAWIEQRPMQDKPSLYSDLLQIVLQNVNREEVGRVFLGRAMEEDVRDGK
jgi:hypothetical protein